MIMEEGGWELVYFKSKPFRKNECPTDKSSKLS